jgi:hypothetical protein
MGIVVVVVMVMMVVVVMMFRSTHHSFDAADNATGHSTDHTANRTGGAPTFGRASLTTPDNSLSLSGERHRKNDKNANKACGYGQPAFHR